MDFYKRKSTKREDTKKEDGSQNRLRIKQMSVNDIDICSSGSSDKVNPKVEEGKGGATGPTSTSMHKMKQFSIDIVHCKVYHDLTSGTILKVIF